LYLRDIALVSCVVAPGFDFADFEMAELTSLLEAFPDYGAIVQRLTLKN
jgi:predicted cupin superfamily sugar epimerase